MDEVIAAAMQALQRGDAGPAERAIADMEMAGTDPALIAEYRGRLALLTHNWLAAHDHLQHSIHLNRRNTLTWYLLGVALIELGLFEYACEAERMALAIEPSNYGAWVHLGSAAGLMGNDHIALASFAIAQQLAPEARDVHQALGRAWYCLGNDANAIHHARLAQKFAPEGWAHGEVVEASALLRSGDWLEGWKKFEGRWRLPTPVAPWHYRGQPLYTGDLEGLRGKRVLLRSEQGFGDSIHFARYVEPLSEIASHIILETQTELVRLFAPLPAEIVVAPKMENQVRMLADNALPPWDVQTSLMSLPLLFGTTPDTVPPPTMLDFSEGTLTIGNRIDIPDPPHPNRIGFCWAGGARREEPLANAVDQRRSIPKAHFQRIIDAAGERGLSLMQDDLPGCKDFQDTADVMGRCGLVITVDTAIAHLSASLGIETFMLSRFDCCWRWALGATSTPWYPAMRIFPQPALGDWESVIRDVVKALGERDGH